MLLSPSPFRSRSAIGPRDTSSHLCPLNGQYGTALRGADGAGLDPAAADLAGGGGDRGVLPVQGVERGVQAGLAAQRRQQVVRVLVLREPAGVLPGGLHRVGGDDHPGQGKGFQQRSEVAGSSALPALATLSWPITSPVT